MLGCQTAYIEPDFKELAKRKAITLKCTLKNATFFGTEEKAQDELLALLPGNLTLLSGRFGNILYETIYTTLMVYNDRVEFLSYEAHSRDIKLFASGSMGKKGGLKISAKVFLSPEIASQLPEELRTILTQESGGWLSCSLDMENGRERPFLKLESDRFRINFEQIETQ